MVTVPGTSSFERIEIKRNNNHLEKVKETLKNEFEEVEFQKMYPLVFLVFLSSLMRVLRCSNELWGRFIGVIGRSHNFTALTTSPHESSWNWSYDRAYGLLISNSASESLSNSASLKWIKFYWICSLQSEFAYEVIIKNNLQIQLI